MMMMRVSKRLLPLMTEYRKLYGELAVDAMLERAEGEVTKRGGREITPEDFDAAIESCYERGKPLPMIGTGYMPIYQMMRKR